MDEPKSSTVFDPLNTSYQSILLAKLSRTMSTPDKHKITKLKESKTSIKYSQV